MFATNLVMEFQNVAEDQFDQLIITNGNTIINTIYQQLYDFLKASVNANIILNTVEESFFPTSTGMAVSERFLSNNLESAQQFQNSVEFQQLFVQLFQSLNVVVTVTTESDAPLHSGNEDTSTIELLDLSTPHVMWLTQFPTA